MDQTTTNPVEPKPVLIIDTNAFIRCLDIRKLHEKYDIYTSGNVLNEIRDKVAREKFQTLGFDIPTASADDKSFSFVDEFSKKTGDYFSLSFTDKELIAIGVSMARQRGKGELLRKQPPALTEYIPKEFEGKSLQDDDDEEEEAPQEDDGFVTVTKGKVLTEDDLKKEKKKEDAKTETEQEKQNEEEEEPEEEEEEEEGEFEGENEEKELSQEEKEKLEGVVLERIGENKEGEQKEVNAEGEKKAEEEDSEDEDDGKGWINMDNIQKKLYKGTKKLDKIKDIGVIIMTADYAMQNVIMQIGLPLLSTEGYVIRQTRRFLLECYCCHKICKVNTKQFCPSCGNPTLSKLSCRVNEDGTMTFFRNPKKKISTRGKIYSIPKTEGGRKNDDLLLREDEFLMRGRLQQLERQEKDKDRKFKQRLKDYENGLTFDDITLQHKYNSNKVQIGYGKVNPNDRTQFRKKK